MNKITKYLRELVVYEIGVPWYIPVIGTVLLAVLANILYDLAKTLGGPQLGIIVAVILLLLTVLFIITAVTRMNRAKEKQLEKYNYIVRDLPKPVKRKGLIFLLTNDEVAKKAITYHKPELENVWFVATPPFIDLAIKLQNTDELINNGDKKVNIHVCPIMNELDSEGCYSAVDKVCEQQSKQTPSLAEIMISDITGGTKVMTAALILASIHHRIPLEHVPTKYDTDGEGKRINLGPMDPIEIKYESKLDNTVKR